MALLKAASPKGRFAKERRSEMLQCYMYLSIPIIGFLVFSIYPILWQMRWSFYSYNMIPSQTKFIGLDNFTKMFTTDFTYWKAWGNTLLFAALKIPTEMFLAMLIALALTSSMAKLKGFFRTMYFMPNVVSVVIVGLMFSNMFGYFGAVNGVLERMGIITQSIDWFASKKTAMAMLVISSIWTSFGVNVMYFISALANVPAEVYESAKLDGANGLQVFWKITLPCIMSVFKIILLLSILGTLGVNEHIIVLTAGGPNMGTHSVMSYLTQSFLPGFAGGTPALGYGCAMSLITTIIFAALGIGYNLLSKKMSSD